MTNKELRDAEWAALQATEIDNGWWEAMSAFHHRITAGEGPWLHTEGPYFFVGKGKAVRVVTLIEMQMETQHEVQDLVAGARAGGGEPPGDG